ncbi:zf-HC2 domain-containing protein [Streptomyces sp. MMS24-I2-30]|uniref:zf-HC2 domain-containing protein n=1 Tax=Streptomyces sp. MMS24-I2-30 TaxID=3351564 RepID=UPI0038969911
MRSLERHRDVGAYALGVLDEAEAFRFEDHLMECPHCAAHLTGFGPTTWQLMLYRRATPHRVHALAQPGPRLLDRLLGEVAARHRARRRRFLYGLAAAVVFAGAGPGIAVHAEHGAPSVRVTATTDPESGVWAQVTSEDEGYGSGVELKVRDRAGPRSCRLVAVGQDGTEQILAGWTVPGHDARTNTLRAASALHPEEIDHYEVRTAGGARLATLPGR